MTLPSKTLLTLIAASVASACAAGPTAGLATRTVVISSQVTIKSRGLTFTGNVTSTNAACRGSRKVTLYRRGSLILGSATTNASGHWKITVAGSAGITLARFYAKVRQRSEGTAGTIYVCKAATSKTISYAL